MYLVLYTDVVRECTEIKGSITVNGKRVSWPKGGADIECDFIIVDDPVNVGDTVTDALLVADRKNEFKKVDEMEVLRNRLESSEMALIQMMDMWGQ